MWKPTLVEFGSGQTRLGQKKEKKKKKKPETSSLIGSWWQDPTPTLNYTFLQLETVLETLLKCLYYSFIYWLC